MSRIVVFDLNNQAVGEFNAVCNRGWMVYGNAGVDGAGMTTVQIPDDVASKPWLQLGRLVLVQSPPLPPWAGVIDTPWKVNLPVALTLYNAEYLFSLRTPDVAARYTGSVSKIVDRILQIMSDQENLYLSLGVNSDDRSYREETLDQRAVWDQLRAMLERTGHEMILRPERDADNRLHLYADVGVGLGQNTGFLLDDGGPGKNMTVIDAYVNGKIINRVMGVSGQSTAEEQLKSDVFEDQDSQNLYRTRSEVVQFRDVTQISTLNNYTKMYLAAYKGPYLDLTVDVKNVGETFNNLRPGNQLIAHTSKVYLPGGVHGWRGTVRALVMVYDEAQDTVRMKLRGRL